MAAANIKADIQFTRSPLWFREREQGRVSHGFLSTYSAVQADLRSVFLETLVEHNVQSVYLTGTLYAEAFPRA